MKEEVKREIAVTLYETGRPLHKFMDLKDVKVTLVDYTPNFYKSIVNASMMTWTRNAEKWSCLNPETRFEIVKQVLENKALPLAKEFGQFCFRIENVSRSCFDQIARSRLASYSSMGTKDDDLNDLNFMMPSRIKDTEHEEKVMELFLRIKQMYNDMQKAGIPNWACRCIIPAYYTHNFMMRMDFLNLQGFCKNRMEVNEQEDTVAVAWLMRERVKEVYPLLATYLKPLADFTKKDMIMAHNGFSEIIGIPHINDARWASDEELEEQKKIAKFHEPCTNLEYVERKTGVKVEWPLSWTEYTWETLPEIDKKKFMED